MAEQKSVTISVSDEIFELMSTCKLVHLDLHLISAEGKDVQVQFDFPEPVTPELAVAVH